MLNRSHKRLQLDVALARSKKHNKWTPTKHAVLETWGGTLKDQEGLPEDWIGAKGVLVGIRELPPADLG